MREDSNEHDCVEQAVTETAIGRLMTMKGVGSAPVGWLSPFIYLYLLSLQLSQSLWAGSLIGLKQTLRVLV